MEAKNYAATISQRLCVLEGSLPPTGQRNLERVLMDFCKPRERVPVAMPTASAAPAQAEVADSSGSNDEGEYEEDE